MRFRLSTKEMIILESVEYFNSVANRWDTMRRGFFPEAVREKMYALAELKPGMVIADIGAGTGFVTEGLAGKEVQIIAVDYSIEMLREMQKKLSASDFVEYRLGESESLPLEDDTVDYVMTNMYLHHVENPLAAVREMVRILKKDGRLILTDLDEHGFDFLRTEHNDTWMGFKRSDIAQWFKLAGLKNVQVDCISENCCAASDTYCDRAHVSIFIASGEK
ncbi:MAG: class I SAM-dependent methyltransferase [Bacillota bacterium]|nr:class I SAM-dependent methyltransferase [Bacillota bacterium]MDW7684860.1 class I SAM-dependent methyltransferase [Bacillota bacterium]